MNSGIKLESFNLRDEFRDGVINLSTGMPFTSDRHGLTRRLRVDEECEGGGGR